MKFSKIFSLLAPKDIRFFPLFDQAAQNLVDASVLLHQLILTTDETQIKTLCQQIKELETRGDAISVQIYKELSGTFITPFDREDIQQLASSVDDVVDAIYRVATKIELFSPKSHSDKLVKITEILQHACLMIRDGVNNLNKMKNPKIIETACISINNDESEVDKLFHQGIYDLFHTETNAIELIKKKEILQTLEKAIDQAEDVSDVLKTILVKSL